MSHAALRVTSLERLSFLCEQVVFANQRKGLHTIGSVLGVRGASFPALQQQTLLVSASKSVLPWRSLVTLEQAQGQARLTSRTRTK